ncbi:MAG: AAA family ATPase [Solidesulfovibrio sp.]
MTQNSHDLTLKRLIVLKSGCHVYDETFHQGVNIIRGKNSPGKSTILSFIFYGLGGENIRWTNEQLQCDKVCLDICANGIDFCLMREVELSARADIYVHDGLYDNANISENWLRFSRVRSSDRESFSEWFFEVLNLPRHKTNAEANLTMYQLLRLLYFDQSTSTSKLLREDSAFDSKDTRGAIGDFLLGLDNLEGREIRQQVIEKSKDLGEITGQVTTIQRFFGKEIRGVKQDVINDAIDDLRNQLEEKNQAIQLIESSMYENIDSKQKIIIEELQKNVLIYSKIYDEKIARLHWLNAEISDNETFLETLNERLIALSQSECADKVLEGIEFKFCPLCLSPIDLENSKDICPLCKHENSKSSSTPYAQISSELKFQIQETKSVIDNQREEAAVLNVEIPNLKKSVEDLQHDLQRQITSVSPVQAAIKSTSREIGYIEASIEQEEKKLRHASKLEYLYKRKLELNNDISVLEAKLDELEAANRDRDISIRKKIENLVLALIKQDIGDEKSFDNPHSFAFDFRNDSFSLDGKQKISDSSMVILKNSFGLALFLESTADEQVRIPAFMMFDNIEDKGMREERSMNFQKIIVNECNKIKKSCQLIMTTSMIDPELNNTQYCVGPYHDRDHPTLDFSKCK